MFYQGCQLLPIYTFGFDKIWQHLLVFFVFFAGDALKQFSYFILVPTGILGNFLSFLVSISYHKSVALYNIYHDLVYRLAVVFQLNNWLQQIKNKWNIQSNFSEKKQGWKKVDKSQIEPKIGKLEIILRIERIFGVNFDKLSRYQSSWMPAITKNHQWWRHGFNFAVLSYICHVRWLRTCSSWI